MIDDKATNELLHGRHLAEEMEKHPYDAKCICKLCDWRRAVTKFPEGDTVPGIDYLSPVGWLRMVSRYDSVPRDYGYLNGYYCPQCHRVMVTIDRDNGVTPANITCPGLKHKYRIATGKADAIEGLMTSAMYRVPGSVKEEMASHEWFRPSYDYYTSIVHEPSAKHVRNGGLLFRKIGELLPAGHEIMTGRKGL